MALFPTSFQLSFTPPFSGGGLFETPAQAMASHRCWLAIAPYHGRRFFSYGTSDYPQTAQRYLSNQVLSAEIGTFQTLFALFDTLEANLRRLQWPEWCFLAYGVSEPFADWRARLPFLINNIRVGYTFGEQMVHEKALGRKLLAPPRPRLSALNLRSLYSQGW